MNEYILYYYPKTKVQRYILNEVIKMDDGMSKRHTKKVNVEKKTRSASLLR